MNNALISGLNYPDSPYRLRGCENDADNIERIAKACRYRCEKVKGIFTADDFYAEAARLRETGKRTGKTLISISSHGTQLDNPKEPDGFEGGVCFWNGDDIEVVPETDFRRAVEQIPGSVFVFLDLCFAGEMTKNAGKPGWSGKFIPFDAGTMSVKRFASTPITKAIPRASRVYWLLACEPQQVSWDMGDGGLFTKSFTNVYDMTTQRRSIKNMMLHVQTICEPDQSPNYKCVGGAASKVVF